MNEKQAERIKITASNLEIAKSNLLSAQLKCCDAQRAHNAACQRELETE